MSDFEVKYLKEVLENLKIIKKDMSYEYTMDRVIEDIEELVEKYGE